MHINAAFQVAQFLWDYKIPVVTTMAVITGIFIAKKWNADPLAKVILKAHPEHPSELKVTTYNVLAPDYVFEKSDPAKPRSQYTQCEKAALEPTLRQKGLIKDLLNSNADILCLQEVEEEALFKPALASLSPLEYEGIFTQKVKPDDRPQPLDGCALFYKKKNVEEILRKNIIYKDGSGHIAQLVILNYQGQYLGVVNTHLKWKDDDAFAMQELAAILEAKEEYPQVASWIICGDFNVNPTSKALEQLTKSGFTTTTTKTSNPTCKAELEVNKVKTLVDIWPDYIFTIALTVAPENIQDIKLEKALPTVDIHSDHVELSARVKRNSPPPS
jgi:endonuclease/exonuclease/phosphatase family metal-dependent hydrolase